MYNRYITEDVSYAPVEQAPASRTAGGKPAFHLPEFLSGGGLTKERLSGLLKTLRLDSLDSGDVLLLLILLYLLVEGEDIDLVIALGLVLFMGLGEN